jgi:tetratricopeptide (TPR) repeat protein
LPVEPTPPTPSSSLSLELVSQSCQAHVQRGVDLAKRGAIYSAQNEFTRALALVGRSLDELHPGAQHHQAIVEALLALEEVDDFASGQSSLKPHRDLVDIISSHRTVALKQADLSKLTIAGATRAYCSFAQAKLEQGCGRFPAASQALYGLARVEISLAREGNSGIRLGQPKAMALYETCVRIDPTNHRAANELGVLLIRYGQPGVAIPFLERSVRTVPSVEGWHNLAVAQKAVGNLSLAQQAMVHRDAMKQQEGHATSTIKPGGGVEVRWVDSATFAANSPLDTTPPTSPSRGPDGQVATGQVDTAPDATQAGSHSDEPLSSTASRFEWIKSGLKSIIR